MLWVLYKPTYLSFVSYFLYFSSSECFGISWNPRHSKSQMTSFWRNIPFKNIEVPIHSNHFHRICPHLPVTPAVVFFPHRATPPAALGPWPSPPETTKTGGASAGRAGPGAGRPNEDLVAPVRFPSMAVPQNFWFMDKSYLDDLGGTPAQPVYRLHRVDIGLYRFIDEYIMSVKQGHKRAIWEHSTL